MKIKVPQIAPSIVYPPHKPLKPKPHTHQARVEQHREVKSLVTDRFKNPIKECGK
jgi:hypothetical protein